MENKDRICLKEISSHLCSLMREIKKSTCENIASMLISQMTVINTNLTGQETIRRRIYDVINVLSAAGIIDKSGKQLVWNGFGSLSTNHPPAAKKNQEDHDFGIKEHKICQKVHTLTIYKALIHRNMVTHKPIGSVHFPLILIGISKSSDTRINHISGCSHLEITSDRPRFFYSPFDILMRLPLDSAIIKKLIEASPELEKFARDVYNHLNDNI